MPLLVAIRRWLADPRELDRGPLMRGVGIVLNLAGAAYAMGFALLFCTPHSAPIVGGCAVVLGVVGTALWRLPARPEYATTSALLAIGVISVILSTGDRTGTVPLFYLWPLVALAYFHSLRFLAASVAWMAASLAPVMLIGATPNQQVTYASAVSIASLVAALVGLMRRDEQRLRRHLEQGSSTDSLTGLLNRRAFGPAYAAMLAHEVSSGDGLSLVLVDLDHFKRFNDTQGHVAGDAALRRVASVLTAASEPGDLVARLGGEEFAVVLPGRGPAAAQRYCDHVAALLAPSAPHVPGVGMARGGIHAALRAQLADAAREAGTTPADNDDPLAAVDASIAADAGAEPAAADGHDAPDDRVPITSSFGIVHASPSETGTPDELLARADEALYAAKHAGRDRVAIWSAYGCMLGQPMHVNGVLAVDAVDALPAAASLAPVDADADAVRRLHERMLMAISACMLGTGALNTFARAALVDASPIENRRLWVIGVALVIGAVLFATGRLTTQQVVPNALGGIAVISLVVALVGPPITAQLFYAWPVAMCAYFARGRIVAAMVAWLAFTLAIAVHFSHQPLSDLGLFVGTTLNMTLLASVISALRWREAKLARGLERAAAIDPLTGTLTRRAFLPAVNGWLTEGCPGFALVLLDLDHFKRYNDEHGHLAGDDALRIAASALVEAAPAGAQVCRFGGEEFAIALPGGGVRAARACVEEIAAGLVRRGSDLTISAGIAAVRAGDDAAERLVGRADQGLYAAKGAGRARVAWFASDAGDARPLGTGALHLARLEAFAAKPAASGPQAMAS